MILKLVSTDEIVVSVRPRGCGGVGRVHTARIGVWVGSSWETSYGVGYRLRLRFGAGESHCHQGEEGKLKK